MPKTDIYSLIKEENKTISLVDIKDSLMDLLDNVLKEKLSEENLRKIAKVRSTIEINLKQ